MPKLFHVDATSCSFDGRSFERAEDGSFDVPDAAVAALVESHGFAPSAEAAAKRAEKPAAEVAAKSANELAAAHVAAQAGLTAERDVLAAKVKELEDQIADLTKPGKKK